MLPLRTGANDAYEMPLVGFFQGQNTVHVSCRTDA